MQDYASRPVQAAVARGATLEVAELEDPRPGSGHVLVKTLACGICGSDLHAAQDLRRFIELTGRVGGPGSLDPDRDLVFGHEFCAEIVDFGPSTERRLPIGTQVCSFPAIVGPSGPQPITVQPNSVLTIAGGNGVAIDGTEGDGGPATAAKIDFVKGLKIAPNGDLLLTEDGAFVVPCADCPSGAKYQYTMLVRRIDWQTGIINSIAGNQTLGAGPDNVVARQSALSYPEAAFVDANGNVVVVDRGNSRLRKISRVDGTIASNAGSNIDDPIAATRGAIYKPTGVAEIGRAHV